MNKRKLDFLKEKCRSVKKENLETLMKEPERKVILRYLLDVDKIETEGVKMSKNRLSGEAF